MLLGKRQRRPPMKMKRTTSMTEFMMTTLDIDLNSTHGHGHPPPHFLRACHLCKRRLIAGRDIFMYKGDSAFCSLECRQQQINQDETKLDKCSHNNNNNTPIASETTAVVAAAIM